MNLSTIFGAVIFLGSVILSQKIAVSAAAKLDDQSKLRIAEVFPKRNVNSSIFLFGVIIVFLIALYVWPEYGIHIVFLNVIMFIVYLIAKLTLNIRKLAEIGAPAAYIRSIKLSFLVFVLGAISAVLVAVGIHKFMSA